MSWGPRQIDWPYMDPERREETRQTTNWRICLECGNRYEVKRVTSSAKWCSAKCQTTSFRTGRNQILESLAIGSRWWLR